jgi:septum formation protein
MRPLILASTSTYRRALLGRLGLPFEVEDPGLDEAPFKHRIADPRLLVSELSLAKARAVAARHPEAWVLGSDQVAVVEGTRLGKPGSRDRAIEQLMLLSGRTHELVTGVALLCLATGTERVALDVTRLSARRFDRGEATRYVTLDEPLDCAGSFKFEKHGVALFSRVETSDPTAIEGLPLTQVVGLLEAAGFSMFDGG